MRAVFATAALLCVTACANGGETLTSPTPVAVVTPTAPSSCAVPATPASLSADVSGTSVSLSWSAVGDATDYVVLVGSSPSSSETILNTPVAYHAIEDIEPGTHYARVHAHNWCGTSDASRAVPFLVE